MTTYKINQQDLNNFVKELRKLGHIIADPNMQLYRAQKFKDYTIEMISSGMLDLEELSELTQIIADTPHGPIWDKGNLLERMGVKPVGKNEAEAGYWDSQGKMAGKDITIAGWVRALHTGFRIPADTLSDKGIKVRTWFWHKHKIFLAPSLKWLIVPPRPFLERAYLSYMLTGRDVEVCDEYLDKLMNSQMDTTRTRGSANV